MDEQAVSRSIPGSAGLLGALTVAGLAVIGLWGFVDSYGSNDYVAPTIGVLIVTLLFVGGLAVLGARSKEWLEGPYW